MFSFAFPGDIRWHQHFFPGENPWFANASKVLWWRPWGAISQAASKPRCRSQKNRRFTSKMEDLPGKCEIPPGKNWDFKKMLRFHQEKIGISPRKREIPPGKWKIYQENVRFHQEKLGFRQENVRFHQEKLGFHQEQLGFIRFGWWNLLLGNPLNVLTLQAEPSRHKLV